MRDRLLIWLLLRLGYGARRGTYVVDAEIERTEELRVDRLGPSHDDLLRDDPSWRLPRGLERPRTRL